MLPALDRMLPTPVDRFGALFEEVQLRRLFDDGKTFADATPRRPTREIMAAYARVRREDGALRRFVADHFHLPAPADVETARPGATLREHIRALWPALVRRADPAGAEGSMLPLTQPYVVPGGRFTELYYWDTYFCLLGLVRDGQEALARSVVEAFTQLIEQVGHIPNGTRTYYLSRSQPPLYFAMIQLFGETDPATQRRHLAALRMEHAFWMRGGDALAPGESAARVVAMPDGARLNRYWDDRDTPRDESYAEDVHTWAASSRTPGEVYRALRAGAESGWDFSSRWLAAADDLSSIRTQHVVPVDLNAFLYGLERTVVQLAEALGEAAVAADYAMAAQQRRAAMHRWLWSDEGHFADFDLERGARSLQLTAATLAPLFTGVATQAQADAVAVTVRQHLLAPGGLRTTTLETGQQWDAPNGWAPLQWFAFAGLTRYGHAALADTVAARWTALVETEFAASGAIHEKYDVEHGGRGQGGEYVPQIGFGWTNGVTATFIDHLATSTGTADPHWRRTVAA